MTFEVLEEDKPVAEGEQPVVREELDDEGNPLPKMQLNEGEVVPKHLVVPEVVREPKMHFFKVPKLGSYMAIRLEYKTCLYEEAFDYGVNDLLRVNELKKLQEEERIAYEKSLIEMKEQAEADGEACKTADKKEWEKIEPKPYQSRTV
jgi:hypothetical protein